MPPCTKRLAVVQVVAERRRSPSRPLDADLREGHSEHAALASRRVPRDRTPSQPTSAAQAAHGAEQQRAVDVSRALVHALQHVALVDGLN